MLTKALQKKKMADKGDKLKDLGFSHVNIPIFIPV
jgi:hypothetical protein